MYVRFQGVVLTSFSCLNDRILYVRVETPLCDRGHGLEFLDLFNWKSSSYKKIRLFPINHVTDTCYYCRPGQSGLMKLGG